MKVIKILISLFIATTAISCSVKEDRWPCPCHIIFEPQDGANIGGSGSFILGVYAEDGLILQNTIPVTWESIRNGNYNVSVSKGRKVMNILEGVTHQYTLDKDLLIVEGRQCDSIYCWSTPVDCSFEEAVVPVRSDKQFATVFLKMEKGEEETYPFNVTVTGNVNGINMLDIIPHHGSFHHRCESLTEDNEFRFRVPRQDDNSLMLELTEKRTEIPAGALPLGEWIAEFGYDWKAQSLEDIYIGVDYARAMVTVRVNDWEQVITISEEI